MYLDKEWGEFFPISISPFAYNETLAQDYFPLTKEEIIGNGWIFRDSNPAEYQLQTFKIPDNIKDVPDSVTKEILACEDCGKNYKIIAQELKFYRKMGLPVPRKCPDCRNFNRMQLRNPRELWERKCNKCAAEIQTTYSPNRPEMLYCDSCYLAEIL